MEPGFLPIGHRLRKVNTEIEWEEGEAGIIDKAKHYSTLFIEEIGDFIQANVDEFLRYEPTLIEDEMLNILEEQIKAHNPDLVGFTIPFPGNLFAALRCAQCIKQYYPDIYVAFGGGYCNTELRSLEDPRIFDIVDFISLDDGEGPLLKMLHYLEGIHLDELERTYVLEHEHVVYKNHLPNTVHHHRNSRRPNYKGLPFDKYGRFWMYESHASMWTDKRWNKLTISMDVIGDNVLFVM